MIGETDSVRLTDNEDMTFDIHFLRRLADVERSVITQLTVIQKPAGVKDPQRFTPDHNGTRQIVAIPW